MHLKSKQPKIFLCNRAKRCVACVRCLLSEQWPVPDDACPASQLKTRQDMLHDSATSYNALGIQLRGMHQLQPEWNATTKQTHPDQSEAPRSCGQTGGNGPDARQRLTTHTHINVRELHPDSSQASSLETETEGREPRDVKALQPVNSPVCLFILGRGFIVFEMTPEKPSFLSSAVKNNINPTRYRYFLSITHSAECNAGLRGQD